MASWSVTGLRELEEKLHELPGKVIRKQLSKSVSAGGRVIRDRMKQLAPVRHDLGGIADVGEVKKSISSRVRVKPAQGTATANIGPKGNTAKVVSRWLELGTTAHELEAKNKKVLSNEREFFGSKARHPGIAPNPFMRTAADETKEKAVDVLADKLREGIEAEAANQ